METDFLIRKNPLNPPNPKVNHEGKTKYFAPRNVKSKSRPPKKRRLFYFRLKIQSVKSSNLGILIKLAWRDSRRQRGRLLLFVSSIIVGIAALVAINSFSENLQKDINGQARELLGADLAIIGLTPPNPSVRRTLDSVNDAAATARTSLVSFLSMAYFPKGGGTRPVNVKAVRGVYPFYGKLETEPAAAAATFQNDRKALIDNTLRLQFDLHVGDSVKIGEQTYQIAGSILSAPGRAGIGASIAPAVFLPLAALDSANLLQRGSRVEYSFFYKLNPKADAENLVKNIKPSLETEKYNLETVADRKRSTNAAFGQLGDFLNLVGFIALLLGCLGVASAVNIYVKDKLPTVAILRTLGASGRQAFLIFLIQIASMGFIGALVGALLGTAIQRVLPIVLKDFLPIETVSNDPSVSAVLLGIVTGVAVSVLFALLPLLQIRRTSPLRVLRSGFESVENQRDMWRYVVIGLISAFIFGFTFLQTKSVKSSFIFIGGVAAALGLLAGVAWLMMWILRRRILRGLSYSVRQSIANLYRPQNQTMTLVVSIGLGTMLISTLLLIQQLLLKLESFENVWECACGEGHLSEVLKKNNIHGRSSDLINRGYSDELFDFLKLPINVLRHKHTPKHFQNSPILKVVQLLLDLLRNNRLFLFLCQNVNLLLM